MTESMKFTMRFEGEMSLKLLVYLFMVDNLYRILSRKFPIFVYW